MNAKSEHLLEKISQLDICGQQHYPRSRKVYVEGSRADLKVPMREISLTATQTESGIEENPPIRDYDTSGIYSDTDSTIDLRAGLPAIRQLWIEERQDTELLAGASSIFGQARQQDVKTAHLRFEHIRQPRRAQPGCNVTQLHYARQGIITPEMEFIAIFY